MPAASAARSRRPTPGAASRSRTRSAGAHSFLFDPTHQPTSYPVSLDKPYRHLFPELEDPTRRASDQTVCSLVADVVIAGQGRYRNEPVGAVVLQGDEQPELGDAADAGGKQADRSGEKRRAVAFDCSPFGSGRTPLGRRDMFADRCQLMTVGVGRHCAEAEIAPRPV